MGTTKCIIPTVRTMAIHHRRNIMQDQSRLRSTMIALPISRLQHGDSGKCAIGTKAEIKVREGTSFGTWKVLMLH